MAETPEKTKPGRPESPTTARELDWDDEDAPPSSPKLQRPAGEELPSSDNNVASTQARSQTTAPADPRQQAEATLREAFPAIDASVVKAVLVASGGQVEPAFNALLSMSDPSAQVEPTPPTQPARPTPQADLT